MNILQYESKIWATADLLRGSGIKESEWPLYMMPFFALAMIESRLVRMFDDLKTEIGEEAFANINKDDLYDMIKDQGQGYNLYIFEHDKTLSDICKNDKSFDIDFDAYLNGFDGETKDLLGVDVTEGEKFLDIKGVITKLKAKKVLMGYTKLWAEIDLKPFDNSEITTLEEHIKRKWADISAETAGEQYTPDDVIALIAEIIASKIEESNTLLKIYDCTCGGGNMLFGVEDRINEKFKRLTQTYGQDWNDPLYALAKIESRFRPDSKIEHGNRFESKLREGKKNEKLTPTKFTNGERKLTEFVMTSFDSTQYDSLADAFAQDIKPFIASLDYKEQPLMITTATAQYWYDAGQETLIKEVNGKKECPGCGKIVVKSSFKNASKKQAERIEISVELMPDYQKDYEIIPFHKDEAANKAEITAFMAKYITKPFRYLENVVGVELNFNKIFYKPEKLREVVDILDEIDALDGELKKLEAGLVL